ncbi:MAG: hypothetical protein ACTS73_04215 [Arsenophonus sp. NEOnobi-MAG3]
MIEDAYQKSEANLAKLLDSLQALELIISPRLAMGAASLIFEMQWQRYSIDTQHQRCWIHKIANVLALLPKGM